MIPFEWSSSFAESQEGSKYLSPFNTDDVSPPLPHGLIDCYPLLDNTQSGTSVVLTDQPLHIGTSDTFPLTDPRPTHSASLQISSSSSGSELSFAEDAIPGGTDQPLNAEDCSDGSIFPFSDPETDYPSYHLNSCVSPFESEEPATHSVDTLNKSTNLTTDHILHSLRTRMLVSLVQDELQSRANRNAEAHKRLEELNEKLHCMLEDHEKMLQSTYNLLNQQIGASASLSLHTDAISQDLIHLSENIQVHLVQSPNPTDNSTASSVCDVLSVISSTLEAENQAIARKLQVLEAEHRALFDRSSYLQGLQTQVSGTFNTINVIATHLHLLAERVQLLVSGCSSTDDISDSLAELPSQIIEQFSRLNEVVPKTTKVQSWQELLFFSTTPNKSQHYHDSQKPRKIPSIGFLLKVLTDPMAELETRLQKHFILTYRYLIQPLTLARLLVLRFCATPSPEEMDSIFSNDRRRQIQLQVLFLLRAWVDLLPEDFCDLCSPASPAPTVMHFLKSDVMLPFSTIASKILRKIECPESATFPNSRIASPHLDAPSLNLRQTDCLCDFLSWSHVVTAVSPKQCAQQLSIHMFDIYSAIRPSEFFKLAWSKPDKASTSPTIQQLVCQFNGLSALVISRILNEDALKCRVQVLEFFIQLADECCLLNNFHATVAIMSGLQHASIYRLRSSWTRISADLQTDLDELTDLHRDNSKLLRRRIALSEGPCIPYIGVYLADLTSIEEGNPLYLSDSSINLQKIVSIARRIEEFLAYQNRPYRLQRLAPLIELLTDFSRNLSPDESHARSLMIEVSSSSLQRKTNDSRRASFSILRPASGSTIDGWTRHRPKSDINKGAIRQDHSPK